MNSLRLRVISPLPEYLDELDHGSALAPRPATLEGKIVGLLPNWRPSALQILEAIGALIEEQCRPKTVIMEQMLREVPVRTGKILDGMREQLEVFARRVDVAVIATGD
jgi:hypothetical protein